MARQKHSVSEMSYCLECKVEHKKSEFYKSYNELYNGVLPFCKNAIKKKVYLNNGQVDVEVFKDILRQMDIPFLIDYWNVAVENDMETIGCYFKDMSLKQNRELKWKDSKFETNTSNKISSENGVESRSKLNIKDLQEKYGYGFSEEEYLNFERKYKRLTIGYKEKTTIHTERLIDYIIKKVKGEMASASGDVNDAKKWEDMAKDAATAAKLNVSQLSKSDITGGVDLIPQLVELVEMKSSLIPVMPKLKEQPYDDADLIIWAIINKLRMIEDKPIVPYKEIWDFYDQMIKEFYSQRGLKENEVEEEINKRLVPFRDLSRVYIEPLYDDIEQFDNSDGDDIDGIV